MLLRSALAFIAVLVFMPGVSRAELATSTSFRLERGVFDVLGGRGTSTGFMLQNTLGQSVTGYSTSTSFFLRGGFFLPQGVIVPPSSTPPPVIGGGFVIGLAPFPTTSTIPTEEQKEKEKEKEKIERVLEVCDFNNDGRCNMVDLSIMVYHYNRSGTSVARYDLNNDGRVDFYDISIMMFYWYDY